ncbi:unnamed protein product, partial [Owenia fusiformis]
FNFELGYISFNFQSCKMKSLLLAICLIVAVNGRCSPNICSRVRCRGVTPAECQDGIIDPNGGYCGCCPKCVKTALYEAKETCKDKRTRLQETVNKAGRPILGLSLPTCNEDGSFAPKQCKGSVMCSGP